jgi:hypothetical protein
VDITTDDIKATSGDDLDAMLADPDMVPAEEHVYICLDGKKRRQYEEVKARIQERADQHAAAAAAAAEEAARAAAGNPVNDTRLATKTPAAAGPAGPAPRDPEQDLLEQLVREMKVKTVRFVITSIGTARWNEFVVKHPMRKDPASGRYDPRDAQTGFNVSTFWVEVVRHSITEPEMNDARYASLLKKLTDTQFDKLAQAAANVNRQEDDDLPF